MCNNLLSDELPGGKTMTIGTKDGEVHILSPLRAIRAKCKDCCCGSSQEISLCRIGDCALHPYRFGKRPGAVKREATPDQIERLRKARTARLKRRISGSPLSENREILSNEQDEG